MMQTDVKSGTAAAAATTKIFDGRTRVRGILIGHASGGTVIVNDGTGGITKFSFAAPASIGTIYVLIPGEGILCETNVSVVCAAGTTAVVFYG